MEIFISARYPFTSQSSILSGITGMTLVQPVFKPERNTSISVQAKVSV